MNKQTPAKKFQQPPRITLDAFGNPKTDWSSIDTQVEHQGSKIVLPGEPENMDYDVAIDTIARIRDSENQMFDVNELVKGAPWDAIVALTRSMQTIYGVVIAQSIQTFFGEIKPDLITIHVSPTETIQVPAGQMKLPNIEQPVFVMMDREGKGARIQGSVKRKDRRILIEIADLAREIMKTDSVYKGKPIRLLVDEDGNLELSTQPEFLDLSEVEESMMIHTRDTALMIDTNIMALLKKTDACRRHKIPLKRGILLDGKYGTGKTLTAKVAAKVATDNGWTFLMLNRSQGLASAIEFARTYQPCLIFAEDIDRAADRDDEEVNDLVNLMDGLNTKNMEVMIVVTTNFVGNIDSALLRPGRFDAVIRLLPPDPETANRLIRAYARELLADDVDLSEVGVELDGQIPASIREVVERAKLSMLMDERNHLTQSDLLACAVGMKHHLELLNAEVDEETVEERFCGALREMFTQAITGRKGGDDDVELSDDIGAVGSVVSNEMFRLNKRVDKIEMLSAAAANSSSDASKNVKRVLQYFGDEDRNPVDELAEMIKAKARRG